MPLSPAAKRRGALYGATALIAAAIGFHAAGLGPALLSTGKYLPHGYCYTWQPDLIRLHLVSDALIGLAYVSIPLTLAYFIRRRTDVPFNWMFVLFGVFIVACGATHWMEVWTLWYPHYWLAGAVKLVTAAASVPTAVLLVTLVPKALAIPSAAQLREAKERLESEVAERLRAEEALRASQAGLEERVRSRTAELGRANAELERQREQLRQSRDVLALAMRGGRMGAWSRDLVTGAVWWSRELEEIFGVESGAFDGTAAGSFAFVHEDDHAKVEATIDEAVKTRSDYAVEFRFRHASGEWRWMEGRGRATYAPDGTPLHLYGIGIDITARRRSEDELRRLNAELSEADRRKDEFLAVLAHELRNPLAPIKNSVTVLKAQPMPDDQMAWARDVIERQVDQMARLLDDLLDVSRITRNRLELRKERVALAKIVAAAVETSRPAIEAAAHELTVSLPEQPVYLAADPVRMAQVLSNLLNNAAKYTERGGAIRLTAAIEGRELVLSVRDTGIGIAEDHLPRIFDMFAQTSSALHRAEGGLGIGLSLVKALVEMHGGSVMAYSEGPGRGAEFMVRLPLMMRDPLSKRAETPDQPLKAQQRRVLVADDNADAAESLALMLRMSGHLVETGRDGLEAVALAERFRPDVALLDIGMPRMNGYEAAQRIRGQPWGSGILLVALTGWGQDDDKRRAREAGFDHHLTKPVDVAELEKLVASTGGAKRDEK